MRLSTLNLLHGLLVAEAQIREDDLYRVTLQRDRRGDPSYAEFDQGRVDNAQDRLAEVRNAQSDLEALRT